MCSSDLVAESGFAAQTRVAPVLSGQPTEITFFLAPPTPGQVVVPELFGRPLSEALAQLAAAGLRPGRVLDSHGRAVTVTDSGPLGGGFLAPDPIQAAASVLASAPGAGSEVEAGSAVNLLIAAQRVVPTIET